MKIKFRAFGAAAALGIAGLTAAACSSSGPTTGTETLHGSVSGKAVIAALSSSSASFSFPTMTWTGPVSTTARNVDLGNGGSGSEHAFSTPAGDFAVIHKVPAAEAQGGPVSVAKGADGTCTFSQAQSGTYTVVPSKSTGSFAGATGHGTYSLTISGDGPSVGGKCENTSNGPSVSSISQASVAFHATGPLTVGG
jgi:hypothetical protein